MSSNDRSGSSRRDDHEWMDGWMGRLYHTARTVYDVSPLRLVGVRVQEVELVFRIYDSTADGADDDDDSDHDAGDDCDYDAADGIDYDDAGVDKDDAAGGDDDVDADSGGDDDDAGDDDDNTSSGVDDVASGEGNDAAGVVG